MHVDQQACTFERFVIKTAEKCIISATFNGRIKVGSLEYFIQVFSTAGVSSQAAYKSFAELALDILILNLKNV